MQRKVFYTLRMKKTASGSMMSGFSIVADARLFLQVESEHHAVVLLGYFVDSDKVLLFE